MIVRYYALRIHGKDNCFAYVPEEASLVMVDSLYGGSELIMGDGVDIGVEESPEQIIKLMNEEWEPKETIKYCK